MVFSLGDNAPFSKIAKPVAKTLFAIVGLSESCLMDFDGTHENRRRWLASCRERNTSLRSGEIRRRSALSVLAAKLMPGNDILAKAAHAALRSLLPIVTRPRPAAPLKFGQWRATCRAS